MGKLISELESLKLSSAEFRTGSYNEGINAALRLLKSSLPTQQIDGIEELIKKIDEEMFVYPKMEPEQEDEATEDFKDGYNQASKVIIGYLNGLPTQQDKAVVPEFIKSTMELYDSLQEMLTEEYYSELSEEVDDDRIQCWIGDNFDLLCRAWLDMPKTDVVEVPPYADEFLSVGNKAQKLACLVSCKYSILTCDMAEGELKQWLREISMDDLLSLANGYTVEKEQLHYVAFGYDRFLVKGNAKMNDGTDFIWIETWEVIEQNNYEKLTKFTEQEIKAIDKRYWAFAVPVEEESQ